MSDITKSYRKLKKPSWAPKESLFGKVWGVLYIIIFVVCVYVLSELMDGDISWLIVLPFGLNLLFNLMFTPIQFGLKNNYLALVDIILILGTLIWAIIAIFPFSWVVALVYLPYLIWVCIATALQASVTSLNR
jgi:tryptophan-rich sensory protein